MKWKGIARFVYAGVKIMVPQIQKVEDDIKAVKSGPDKKKAVLDAVFDGSDLVESVTDKRLLSDPRVREVFGKVNDAIVEAHNVVTRVDAELKARTPASAAELGLSHGSTGE